MKQFGIYVDYEFNTFERCYTCMHRRISQSLSPGMSYPKGKPKEYINEDLKYEYQSSYESDTEDESDTADAKKSSSAKSSIDPTAKSLSDPKPKASVTSRKTNKKKKAAMGVKKSTVKSVTDPKSKKSTETKKNRLILNLWKCD